MSEKPKDREELKACPFCGERGRLISEPPSGSCHIFCPECGVHTTHYGTEGEAIRAWNRRTPADATAGEEESHGDAGDKNLYRKAIEYICSESRDDSLEWRMGEIIDAVKDGWFYMCMECGAPTSCSSDTCWNCNAENNGTEPTAPAEDSGEEKHPEATCQMCGRDNAVWYAENPLWNKVAPPKGIICPICFAELAHAKGLHIALKCYDMKTDDREGEIENLQLEIASLRQYHHDGEKAFDLYGKSQDEIASLQAELAEKAKRITREENQNHELSLEIISQDKRIEELGKTALHYLKRLQSALMFIGPRMDDGLTVVEARRIEAHIKDAIPVEERRKG